MSAAASSSQTSPVTTANSKAFDPVKVYQVSTIAFALVQGHQLYTRRRALRNVSMTATDRTAYEMADWDIPAPNTDAFARWVHEVVQWGREADLTVFVGIAGLSDGKYVRSMLRMPVTSAVDFVFEEIEDEEARWHMFSMYLKRVIELNKAGTPIRFGHFVATPLVVQGHEKSGRLHVQYVANAPDASYQDTEYSDPPSSLSANPPTDTYVHVAPPPAITQLPATLPCGHEVPVFWDSWQAGSGVHAFCMKCLDPVIDYVQAKESPTITLADWDAWVEAEQDEGCRAALRELQARGWVSRGWLQVVRMAGAMFGVANPHSPTFAAKMAVLTGSRLKAHGLDQAVRVLEWVREDVVRGAVWVEDKLELSGHFAPFLFDWVEEFGRDTFIQSRGDVYWYLDQYSALADAALDKDLARATVPLPPPTEHAMTAATLTSKFPPPALEAACTTVARLINAGSTSTTPRSRRSRFSTAASSTSTASGTSTESSASQLSEESFAAFVSGRLRLRTSSAQLVPVAHAYEGEPPQDTLASAIQAVALAESAEHSTSDESTDQSSGEESEGECGSGESGSESEEGE